MNDHYGLCGCRQTQNGVTYSLTKMRHKDANTFLRSPFPNVILLSLKGQKGMPHFLHPPLSVGGEYHEIRQGHGWVIFQPKNKCYIFQQLISTFRKIKILYIYIYIVMYNFFKFLLQQHERNNTIIYIL